MRMDPPPPWLEFAVLDDQKRPIANLANALAALRHQPELASLFSFDEMRHAVWIGGKMPAAKGMAICGNGAVSRVLTDADVIAVQEFMQHAGLPRIGRETIRDAIVTRARERAFHPLRDYLTGLVWDQRPRLSLWLATYLGAEANEYSSAVGRMFLISAVARVFDAGCKVDHVPILQGEQGIEKSKACAVLGGEWFSDNLPNLRDKDAQQFLRGRWIIEIPELAAFNRADVALLKSFITRASEAYRPSYGRQFVDEPRHCVFVGTTNNAVFLKDETGGRRFWPVAVTRANIDALAADRDQLFAEAVAAYRARERWWPSKEFETRVIRAEQDARYEGDPWREQIAPFVAGRESVLVGQVAVKALGFETTRIGKSDAMRIAAVLASLGFRRSDKKNGDGHFPYLKM